MDTIDEIVSLEIDSDTLPPNKRRKKKSMVWDHFTTESASPGTTKACCNHCNKSFAYMSGTKMSGTSHLKRHIQLGICRMNPEIKQLSQSKEEPTSCPPPKKRQIYSPNVPPLDQDRCNHEMAKMIIMHDYPLHMAEHPGFAGFVKALRPQFNVASFDTIHGDCVTMFLSQKQTLLEFIGEIPGGVNLTVDLWSSNQSVGYAFVTGHFVDKDWNLTHRLLNVAVVASPDSDFALNQPVAACLSDWKLEGKISSLAVSQSLVNKTSVDNLRGFMSVRNQHVLNGQLLMGKCYAHLLSSMAQDTLTAEQLQEPIQKVRDSIKYVKTNENCGDRFDELKRQFPTHSFKKDLLIDNRTRWDTTYNMLSAACEHIQVFSCLEVCHPEYRISISSEEWKKIESLCSCLKVLFEAGEVLTRPNQMTANDLYHEMTNLQLELSRVAMCEDPDVRNLANLLMEKFDQYWRGCYLVLAVAVVLDPRFKMHLIEFTFNKSYGEDANKWIKTVDDAVHDLYLNYSEQNLLDAYVDHGFSETEVAQEPHFHQDMPEGANTGNVQSSGDGTSPQVEQTTESHQHERELKVDKQNVVGLWEGVSEESQLTEEEQQHGDDSQAHAMVEEDHTSFPVDVLLEEGTTLITIGESLSDFETYISEMKTELDQYLEETLIPRSQEFNVLSWWRLNSTTYPTLAKMALDLLSVPLCTVSPDSVYDTEVKQMDSYRTSLPHVTLEAVLCSKDWFKSRAL
ncbi:Zinc finger BED domain-containing protein DAYSLEEPER [Cardamine amara subsp. amara]|uniref:Zinc finger BED domain-containing protein DAYSLEEPER n=1 Tax=Cardamine amara subsp. amara TaxID=228776 RepID=A0ABD1ABR7_CARAN